MTHTSTEQPEALLPCPFCGKEPTLTKHHKEDAWGLTHRCEVIGPISFSWGSRELRIERWNRRTPASQAQRVPLSVVDAIKQGLQADEATRHHCRGTTNWAAAMTRFYERADNITQEKQG